MRFNHVIMMCCIITACNKNIFNAGNPDFRVDAVGLELPQTPGWIKDTNIKVENNDLGGIVLRLIRVGGVVGSPRLDVVLEPLRGTPSNLDEYLTRNLREMALLEEAGQLRITKVEQESIQQGDTRGYLVRHTYTLGKGGSQVALSQVSCFFVVSGRGVTVTAVGRSELFAPLANEIEKIIRGIIFGVPGISISHREKIAPESDKVQEVPPEGKLPTGL